MHCHSVTVPTVQLGVLTYLGQIGSHNINVVDSRSYAQRNAEQNKRSARSYMHQQRDAIILPGAASEVWVVADLGSDILSQ